MKKALVSQKDLHETTSGVPRKVHQEIRLLSSLGFETYAIAEKIDNNAVKNSQGIPVKTFRWPFSGYFRRKFYAQRVQAWIDKNKPDIVIGHGDIFKQDLLYIHNCVHLAFELMNGKPMPADHEVGRIHSQILSEQNFKLLVCNSKLMQDDLTKRFNIPIKKTIVIHPEVDKEKFNQNNAKVLREKRRKILAIDEKTIIVGLITSGNFKKRNVGLLIEAAKNIVPNFPDVKFLIAGKNKDNSFLAKVDELGLTSHFVFAPSIAEVEEYYHTCDIFILPAIIEEFGRSVLEAMICGKPVVVSKMVGSSEILERNSREFILHEISAKSIEEKLVTLLRSEDLRRSLGELNCEVAKKYSAENQNLKLKDVLTNFSFI